MNKSLLLLTFLASGIALADSQTFTVDKMTCGSCVERVETKVCKPMLTAKKLTTCEVTVGQVVVTADKVNVDEIKAAIDKQGYPVKSVAATVAPAAPVTK